MDSHLICIKALLTRDTHMRYGPLLSGMTSLEREHKTILETIRAYYDEFPDQNELSVDELQIYFLQRNPAIKDKTIYQLLFDQFRTLKVDNPELLQTSLKRVVDFHFSSKVTAALVLFLQEQSQVGIESITPMIQEYSDLVNRPVVEEVECGLREIINDIRQDGLTWSMKSLNDIIGPVYPGTLGHVLARPEVGKTAFCVSQMAWFAYQLRDTDHKIVFMSNEEAVNRTRARTYASLLGQPIQQLLEQDDSAVEELFKMKGGKNIRFVGDANSIVDIERAIAKHKPRVLIIDQGPKVGVPGNYTQVEARQNIYNRFRTLAVKHRIILISVGQADSAADNRKWVTFNHIDGSKVGIPGECDYILGIGASEGTPDYRYFCISKNKLGGQPGRFAAKLDTLTNRYKEII